MDSTHSENRIVDLLSDASLDVVGITVDTGAVGVGPTRTASRISSEIEEVASDGAPISTTAFGPQHFSDIDECIRASYSDVTVNKPEIKFGNVRVGRKVTQDVIIENVNATKLNLITTHIPASFGISEDKCIKPAGEETTIQISFEPKSPDAVVGTIFGCFHFIIKESGQKLSVSVSGTCF